MYAVPQYGAPFFYLCGEINESKKSSIVMTDFQYILEKAKLFHYKGWEEGELQKCLGMLPTLSREDLVKLYRSKWINEKRKIRQSIFNILFKEIVG